MLMDYAPFSRETVIAMEAFLSDLEKPMCFVGKSQLRTYVVKRNGNHTELVFIIYISV
jgi:hypothetical protein